MSWFVVDVEADGPAPGLYSMVSFGVVRVDENLDKTFYGQVKPITDTWDERALSISGFSREEHEQFYDPSYVMLELDTWLMVNSKGRPVFLSDNCLKYSTRIIVDESFSHLKSYKKRNHTVEIYDIVKNKINLPIPTYNFKTKKIERKKIINWYDNNPEDHWIKIQTKLNRNAPSYTKSHPLYVNNKGWVCAENISVGDELLQIEKYDWNSECCLDVFKEEVVKITTTKNTEKKKYRKRNYCIDVEDNHNFFTTSGLVHNCAFDWQFINYYFHRYLGRNPFGYSGRRIGDMYCGMMKDSFAKWKHLRKTKHTHHPVDDAKGNAEAILAMRDMGLKIPSK
jgi:hypothetical protein